MRQGCEQLFIEIGRGNRAEDVLRASRVQPPSCFTWAKGATGLTPEPSCVWGGVQACIVGRGSENSGQQSFCKNNLWVQEMALRRGCQPS